jgi:hypothetical protein
MRQSEGNKTAKRLSAIWLEALVNSEVSNHRGLVREAIERPATAALAWAARIRSPLLLKTASLMPAKTPPGGRDFPCLATSIAAFGPARQRFDSCLADSRNLPLCFSIVADDNWQDDP